MLMDVLESEANRGGSQEEAAAHAYAASPDTPKTLVLLSHSLHELGQSFPGSLNILPTS
jgi:hypothetical protein